MPAAERAAFADRECAGDAALREALLGLLTAGDDVGSRFNPDKTTMGRELLDLPRKDVPELIGPYRIGQEIGKGGMGVVYQAEQKNPQRRVALKVIKLGMDTAQVVARFEQERQALAILDHPNIAKVLDAGATETGRPYFVMEFVQGVPIAEYCDTNKLSIDARLRLFEQVCQAVQHAHTKGIIHRDLKPSNVLVSTQDGKPFAKVIDFGVAKATAAKLTEKTLFTEHRQLIGTPEYMSPEQAEGSLDIDTRTDVYSLGVLLYELLTGTTPFDSKSLRSAAYGEIQRIIREVDPPKPSTRLGESKDTLAGVAARRHTEPGRLASTIRGELDWIVMKALEKDRQRRYETANGLAMDIRRYLKGEAVVAAPPSRAYRAKKFVRRNKGLVLALSAVAVALTAGLAASTTMYLREQRARERADAKERLSTAVREYMIGGLLLAAGPDRMGYDVKMLDVLTKASDGLHEQFKDNPDVEASIRSDLASVLCQIGKPAASIEQWKLAIPLLEATRGKDDRVTVAALNSLCTAYQMQTANNEWLATANESLARARRALSPSQAETIYALNQVGGALVTLGRHAEAAPILREGFAAATLDPKANAEAYGNILIWLTTCEEQLGNKDAAFEMRKRTVEFNEKTYGPDHRASIASRSNLAVVMAREGRAKEAAEIALGLIGPAERAFPPLSPDRGAHYLIVGNLLGRADQFEESEKYIRKAYDIHVALFPEFNWSIEQNINNFRALYRRWPGHAEQLREWCVQGIKARMMLARADELKNLPDAIASAKKQVEGAGGSFEAAEALDAMWARRDAFAPEGHRRRTSYFANYARLAILLDRRDHVDEALRLAESSLPTAIEPENATPLLEAARREAGK
jgi:serine/threonine protein kinase